MPLLPEQSGLVLALPSRDRLPSLPEWLPPRIGALRKEVQADSMGKHRLMVVLPASMMLTASERAIVEELKATHLKILDLEQTILLSGRDVSNQEAHALIIARLLLKGGAKLDRAISDTLTEEYLDAIEDLPACAILNALRKWNRAESPQLDKEHHNFNFRPAPPTLRRLVKLELAPIKHRIQQLHDLLDAVPLCEPSKQHCEKMHALLSGLSIRLQTM
jgi:hypothetical protein